MVIAHPPVAPGFRKLVLSTTGKFGSTFHFRHVPYLDRPASLCPFARFPLRLSPFPTPNCRAVPLLPNLQPLPFASSTRISGLVPDAALKRPYALEGRSSPRARRTEGLHGQFRNPGCPESPRHDPLHPGTSWNAQEAEFSSYFCFRFSFPRAAFCDTLTPDGV